MIIFNRLYQLRKRRKLHMYEVANAIGVNRATYSAWENMSSLPSLRDLFSLSQFFKVPINELYWAKFD